jgi:hypothetical protein
MELTTRPPPRPVNSRDADAQKKAAAPPTLRFEISVPASAHAQPITGRVYVMITRTLDVTVRCNLQKVEPRLQIGRTGVPFFGRDVEKLAPGQAAVIDETDLGSPVESLKRSHRVSFVQHGERLLGSSAPTGRSRGCTTTRGEASGDRVAGQPCTSRRR